MKEPLTLSQILGLLGVIVVPLLIWSISVETRIQMQGQQLHQAAKNSLKLESKIDKIESNTLNILLELERLKK